MRPTNGLSTFLVVLLPLSFGKNCEEDQKLKLEDPVAIRDGGLLNKDAVYARDEFWKEGQDFYICQCDIKPCIRLCNSAIVKSLNFTINDATLPENKYQIDIVHNISLNKTVDLNEHFYVIKEDKCEGALSLDPKNNEGDQFTILANGSIHFINKGDGQNSILHHQEFCILFDENGTLQVFECFDLASDEIQFQVYVYPIFMVMSIISLFLTLLAFILTPEMKTLHGKSVACESFTLMMAFVGLTVTHLSGTDSAIIVCKIFACIGFTFLLSSFFWLNTMCFDIFWTFGNFATMTGSLQQTHEKKFRMYALYSTLYPLINLVIVVIFDFTLTEDSFLWPGIGHGKCWFRSHTLDFLYYQGPAMILLVLNISFFFITLIKINKMKSEARILKKGESMTHGGNGGCVWDDKQRFALYVKMFLLMGGLWIMETISWAAESKPKWLWVPFDIFNSSRGVFIFLFCVACNLKVRNSLMSRFKPQNVHPERPEISCTAQKRSCQINKTSEVSITCGETLATKPLHNNHNFKWAETSV